jgi:hypothetical protein
MILRVTPNVSGDLPNKYACKFWAAVTVHFIRRSRHIIYPALRKPLADSGRA